MKMTRKIGMATAALSTGFMIQAMALEDIALPTGGPFYDGKTVISQTDTITTTTNTSPTLFTPRYVNDFLRGWVSGSNSLWMAKGTTTNDWFLVNTGSPISASDIAADAVTEAKLKAVDTASDEDILTYESTTGDFEWHSVAEIQAKFTEGSYADSTIVSADIKNGEIVDADLSASAAVSISKLATSGQFASGVKQTYSVLSVSVADAATLTPVPETMYVLTPTGMALDGTVTITLNPLAPANAGTGTVFWICNSDAATGLVAIAKTGTFYSPALSITTGAVATVYNFGVTNKYYGR
jgi:hypothetical protein